MLFGERAKYATLVRGICFPTILMTQGLAMFFGILSFSYATATNIRAPIWVVDPLVQQVDDNQPLRDTDIPGRDPSHNQFTLGRRRSIHSHLVPAILSRPPAGGPGTSSCLEAGTMLST